MKTIAFAEWNGVIAVAYGKDAASPEDWQAYVAFVREHAKYRQRCLVHTRGGTLEGYQRRELDQAVGPSRERDRRVAVMTDGTFARGFLKALAIFDPTYRPFSLSDLEAAFAYLEVPKALTLEGRRVIAALDAEIQQ